MMNKIVYPELSYVLTGICFRVQNDLGRFCRERQYADKLEMLLRQELIPFQREFPITNFVSDSPKGNRVDFLVDQKIIIECKAKNFITKDDYFQVQRYLRAANLELGFIVNFRSQYLKQKRVLNTEAPIRIIRM